jgi:hypothetical protein
MRPVINNSAREQYQSLFAGSRGIVGIRYGTIRARNPLIGPRFSSIPFPDRHGIARRSKLVHYQISTAMDTKRSRGRQLGFANLLICKGGIFGGPDRDRTDDLFHAMEARSQLRHRPTKGRTSFILLEHAKYVKHPPRGNRRFTLVLGPTNVQRSSFRDVNGVNPAPVERLFHPVCCCSSRSPRYGSSSCACCCCSSRRVCYGQSSPCAGQRAGYNWQRQR